MNPPIIPIMFEMDNDVEYEDVSGNRYYRSKKGFVVKFAGDKSEHLIKGLWYHCAGWTRVVKLTPEEEHEELIEALSVTE